jgi:hypothetical protein
MRDSLVIGMDCNNTPIGFTKFATSASELYTLYLTADDEATVDVPVGYNAVVFRFSPGGILMAQTSGNLVYPSTITPTASLGEFDLPGAYIIESTPTVEAPPLKFLSSQNNVLSVRFFYTTARM